jgi:uncharacterized membrane protein YphA (DoxX/SURF4 family)
LVLSIALGVVFVVAGAMKLAGSERNVEDFEHWGYPAGFVYVVGFGEALAGVLFFIPRTRFWAGAGIVMDMTGATLTHINAAPPEWAFLPVVATLLVLAAVVAVLTRPLALRAIDDEYAFDRQQA